MTVTREDIARRIDELLAGEFEVPREELSPEGRLFEDYDLDSLDAIDMLLAIEKIFDVKLTEEERGKARAIRLVRDVYDFVFATVSSRPS